LDQKPKRNYTGPMKSCHNNWGPQGEKRPIESRRQNAGKKRKPQKGRYAKKGSYVARKNLEKGVEADPARKERARGSEKNCDIRPNRKGARTHQVRGGWLQKLNSQQNKIGESEKGKMDNYS